MIPAPVSFFAPLNPLKTQPSSPPSANVRLHALDLLGEWQKTGRFASDLLDERVRRAAAVEGEHLGSWALTPR